MPVHLLVAFFCFFYYTRSIMVNDTNTTEVESEKDADFEIKQRDIAKHPMEALLKQKIDAGMYIKIGDIVDGTILFREGNRLFIDISPHNFV